MPVAIKKRGTKQDLHIVEPGAPVLDHAEVAALAHSYWLERGCQGGSPEDDWYRAEAELLGRNSRVMSANQN